MQMEQSNSLCFKPECESCTRVLVMQGCIVRFIRVQVTPEAFQRVPQPTTTLHNCILCPKLYDRRQHVSAIHSINGASYA